MTDDEALVAENLLMLARDIGRWQQEGEYEKIYAAYRQIQKDADAASGTALGLLEVAQGFLRLLVPGGTPNTEPAQQFVTAHGMRGIQILLGACSVVGWHVRGDEPDLKPLLDAGLVRQPTAHDGPFLMVRPSLVGPVRQTILIALWEEHLREPALDALRAWRAANGDEPSACEVPPWMFRVLGALQGGAEPKLLGYPAVAGGERVRFL